MASRRSARLAALLDSANVTDTAPPPPPPATVRKRSAAQATAVDGAMGPPSTPRKKRRALEGVEVPNTPTPAAVKLMTEGTHATQTSEPVATARLSGQDRNNGLAVPPTESRRDTQTTDGAPGTVGATMARLRASISNKDASTTLETAAAEVLKEACAHLIKVDPRMAPLIAKHHCRIFSPEGLLEQIDPFESLCSSIISQQVSGAAAKSIKARFVALFKKPDTDTNANTEPLTSTTDDLTTTTTTTTITIPPIFPRPDQVAQTPIPLLRTAGLSQSKAEYVQGLAEQFVSGKLAAHILNTASYNEVIERLTAVRGLGRWTAEMFACFALKHLDVFALDDLGVQRGMAAFVGRDVAKLKAKGGGGTKGKWKYMSKEEMEGVSEGFRPFRSVFMWYMWRVEETDTSTME